MYHNMYQVWIHSYLQVLGQALSHIRFIANYHHLYQAKFHQGVQIKHLATIHQGWLLQFPQLCQGKSYHSTIIYTKWYPFPSFKCCQALINIHSRSPYSVSSFDSYDHLSSVLSYAPGGNPSRSPSVVLSYLLSKNNSALLSFVTISIPLKDKSQAPSNKP